MPATRQTRRVLAFLLYLVASVVASTVLAYLVLQKLINQCDEGSFVIECVFPPRAGDDALGLPATHCARVTPVRARRGKLRRICRLPTAGRLPRVSTTHDAARMRALRRYKNTTQTVDKLTQSCLTGNDMYGYLELGGGACMGTLLCIVVALCYCELRMYKRDILVERDMTELAALDHATWRVEPSVFKTNV